MNFPGQEENHSEDVLPNGHKRSEYYEQGYSDLDINMWGLNLSGAPSPQAAGWVLMDMMNGDFDGEIDF